MIHLLLTLLLVAPPEASSGIEEKQAIVGHQMMVVTANRHATDAAYAILQQGGSALDAAIAAQMVLGLVEPQSSGLGGGAFLLYYDKKRDKVLAYDGRETAPKAISDTLFSDDHVMIGGKAVGVPGLLAMLEMAHGKHGKLPWSKLFQSAISLSINGFDISPRLQTLIETTPYLDTFEETRSYLFGKNRLTNPRLAATYRLIAKEGSFPFYHGEIAQAIVAAVQNATVNPGTLTLEDLAAYRPVVRRPLTSMYQSYTLYGFPPPSAGGIAVFQILQMLRNKNLKKETLGTLSFVTQFCNASYLAFADRNYYIADPDFFEVPVNRLLDPSYLKKRSKLFDGKEGIKRITRGTYPSQKMQPTFHASLAEELPCTSQICVVDKEGNAVSLTTSIENAFGSTLMAAGFFLNNQLTDFSPSAGIGGVKAANGIEPGKRPMSAMAPTFVFDKEDNLYLVLGSAGGPWIIDYVAQALLGVLEFGMNIQDAIAFPHYGAIQKSIDLEENTFLSEYVKPLEERGFSVDLLPMPSGTQGIEILEDKMIGATDPRREGTVATSFIQFK